MAGRPLGVTILALLQLLGALALLAVSALALSLILLLPLLAMLLALIPLIIGIVGLILFYGLWNLKSWAWIWTILINLLTIITSLGDITGNIISIAISVLIIVYMFSPGIKSHFR